jgi:hypothetical protein
VEKTSLLQHGPSCFYKTNQHEGPSKWNNSTIRNESSRKNHERSTHGHLMYPKDL